MAAARAARFLQVCPLGPVARCPRPTATWLEPRPWRRRSLLSTTSWKEKSSSHVDKPDAPPVDVSKLVELRIQELTEAGALKYPRYQPSSGATTMSVKEFQHDQVSENSPSRIVELSGRVMKVKRLGRALAFVTLRDHHHSIDVMYNLAHLEAADETTFSDMFRLVKRGDHISTVGRPSRAEASGKLILAATQLPVPYSPHLVPLPFKLSDEGTKMQHRHLDLLISQKTTDALRLRWFILSVVRNQLTQAGFVEVQTPLLAANAGGAVARPFSTTSSEFPSKSLALRIAPELWLKRLVVAGFSRVFELGPAFRNEGLDATHNPEFTTCEFYATFWTLEQLISHTETMMCELAHGTRTLITNEGLSTPLPQKPDHYRSPFLRFEFIPTLEARLGFSLPDLASPTALQELSALLATKDIDPGGPGDDAQPDPSLPKLLDRLATSFIEPQCRAHQAPFFLTHHPECMAPLAKSFRCPATHQLVSARAELYVGGMEMANMYEEENDPFAQRRKLERQAREQEHEHEQEGEGAPAATAVDESYIACLEAGLPPTGGWGCGVDRLVMHFAGASRISDVLAFGNLRNVVGLAGAPTKGAVGTRGVSTGAVEECV